MELKKAFITGINGQAGSYMSDLLLSKRYEVHGTYHSRVDNINKECHIYECNMRDYDRIINIIDLVKPHEIYNFAAQANSVSSFHDTEYTDLINASTPIKMMIHCMMKRPESKFLQVSSSEMFGNSTTYSQNENTPFSPITPYAIAKRKAYNFALGIRKAGYFVSNAILFNAESFRRKMDFVTKKIVFHVVNKSNETLYLGNISAKRDWGYMPDYVECMRLILQYDTPEDFVIATGQSHSVEDFCNEAFRCVDIDLRWSGFGENRQAVDDNNNVMVKVSKEFYRDIEYSGNVGDITKTRELLKWKPKHSFSEMVKIMVQEEQYVRKH